MRRFLVAAVVSAAACLMAAGAVDAQPPISRIGPHQAFIGQVNGAASNAVIRMACFGPERIGQLGHPFSGQTVTVQRAPHAAAGFTGLADQIQADIFFVTPAARPTPLALFSFYDDPAPISTSLEFPCSGSGQVVFEPVAGGPTARPAVVRVSFVPEP